MKKLNEDQLVFDAIQNELKRQRDHIELIASENYVSEAVMEAQGSILTNKYAEGYPGRRYYGGCMFVDVVEDIARDRVKKLFGANFANVQPHSGSQANMGAYKAILNHGDTVLGMKLEHGGHLTHGHPLNFSGMDYNFVEYMVTKDEEVIDYDSLKELAIEHQPKLIVAGASAYSRIIDFKRFREAADACGAYLMVDMAHIAGLVAAGLHPNPMEYADIVTSTTHKTLRGPRGGIILTNDEELAKKIDKSVFPGIQGGPLMHVIGAKAVSFKEALTDEFRVYQAHVIENAQALAKSLQDEGFKVISGGTDNHLLSIDVKSHFGLTGKVAEKVLDSIGITSNKNTIPYDTEKPFITSGLRLGSPAMTTRGFTKEDFIQVGKIISRALNNHDNEEVLKQLKEEVHALTDKYPLYEEM